MSEDHSSKGRDQAGLGVQGGLRLLSEAHTPPGYSGRFLNKTPNSDFMTPGSITLSLGSL